MFIDLSHNYVVKNTITEKFSESVEKKLLPRLAEKYGASLLGIQMYEDYISDAFYAKGEWYYPLTVILATGPATEWVKWRMKAGNFKDGLPYTYIGEGLLEINIATEVPAEFSEKLAGRSVYSAGDAITVSIDTPANDPTVLFGRYSQTFVDEMARQLTARISAAMSVSGLESSTVSLSLVFAPGTYMEHTSENVTYRRLLIADNASAPRDFWVKWTREDGAMAYTVSDHVNAENIVFEIGEDVPQKVREKEYRFLLSAGGDKYHNAMGRKNITEWRELIKRAIRRGELVKIETPASTEADDELNAKLAAILGKEPVRESAPETPVAEENDEFARAMAMARAIIAEREAADEPVAPTPVAEKPAEEALAELFVAEPVQETPTQTSLFDTVAAPAPDGVFEEIDDEEALEAEEESAAELAALDGVSLAETVPAPAPVIADEPVAEIDDKINTAEAEPAVEAPAPAVSEPVYAYTEPAPAVSREDIKAQIRAEVMAEVMAEMRLEYESRARLRAEEEAEKHRLAAEELRRKNQQLLEEAEAERARQAKIEEERRAEEAKMRAQLEEQLRAEARERERLAEAAKIALEQARREEEEKARQAALAKAVEERRLEEERRAAEERKRAEEAARLEAERKAAEEKAAKAKEAAALAGSVRSKNYTYTSKTVRLLFRRAVDPNITARIYEIIKTTLEYYGKDKMYMRIKATIPDNTTVVLEFVEIPMEEMALLSNIIKVLGNTGLGIAKAIVE